MTTAGIHQNRIHRVHPPPGFGCCATGPAPVRHLARPRRLAVGPGASAPRLGPHRWQATSTRRFCEEALDRPPLVHGASLTRGLPHRHVTFVRSHERLLGRGLDRLRVPDESHAAVGVSGAPAGATSAHAATTPVRPTPPMQATATLAAFRARVIVARISPISSSDAGGEPSGIGRRSTAMPSAAAASTIRGSPQRRSSPSSTSRTRRRIPAAPRSARSASSSRRYTRPGYRSDAPCSRGGRPQSARTLVPQVALVEPIDAQRRVERARHLVELAALPQAEVALRIDWLAAEWARRPTGSEEGRGTADEPWALAASIRTRSRSGPSPRRREAPRTRHHRSASGPRSPRPRCRRPGQRHGTDPKELDDRLLEPILLGA